MTLIPAFKVQYFLQLLLCLRHQTVKPNKIIISDDSPGDDFLKAARGEQFRRATEGLDVELVAGPKQGQYANMRYLAGRVTADTSYFHILCDDDLIYPEFYAMHLRSLSLSEANCSFSKRWISLENGQPAGVAKYPKVIASSDKKFLFADSELFIKSTLPRCNNWIGEFSNIVYRKGAEALLLDPSINGICHYGLFDLGVFLRCAMPKGSMMVNEYLGAYRRSPSQHSSQIQSPTIKSSVIAWITLSIALYQLNRITAAELFSCSNIVMAIIRKNYMGDSKMGKILLLEPLIEQNDVESYINQFLPLWPGFLEHVRPGLR